MISPEQQRHLDLFAVSMEQLVAAVQTDASGWLESDFMETISLLDMLCDIDQARYDDFKTRFLAVRGLDKLSFDKRCRLIFFLLSSQIDWRGLRSRVVRVKGERTTLNFESLYTSEPPITFDFQQIADQFTQFDPSNDRQNSWADVFARALQHRQPPPEDMPPIVRGAGSKQKPGRKPRSAS